MNNKRGRMSLGKKGSLAVIGLVLALVAIFSSAVYLSIDSDNSLTGAAVGLQGGDLGTQEITGECNISIRESIINIGHDYRCTGTDGFHIDADNIVFDCQNHFIRCISNCDTNTAGIRLNGRTNVTIRNCYVYNFTSGLLLEAQSSQNVISNNYFLNNSHGIYIHNSTANNITLNEINESSDCGVNVTGLDNAIGDTSTYNKIWDNKIWNSTSGGYEACNDASYNYWYLEKNCNTAATNVRGGPCIAGNWWGSYDGRDISGDGLGDTLVPYKGGAIIQNLVGDYYPLVNICEIPGIATVSTTCPAGEITSDTGGEGLAITTNDIVYTCNGTQFNGNNSNFASDRRGIELVGVNNVTIVGCEIYNFSYGIYIQNSYNINLVNLTVRDNNYIGIYVGELAYNITIDNSTVKNSATKSQKYGVWLRSSKPGGANNVIISSTIHNNTVAGIYLNDNSDTNTITSNNIYLNRNGIIINNSDGNSIIKNHIHHNNVSGIYSFNSDSTADWGTAASSTLNNISNNFYGINLERSTSTANVGGTIYNNTYGILLNNSDVNVRSAYINTSIYGIYVSNVYSSSNLDIDDVIVGNCTYGLYVTNATNLRIANLLTNTYSNNTYGIYFSIVNNTNLSADQDEIVAGAINIYNNSMGIYLENSSFNRFENLKIYDGVNGFNLNRSNNNTLKGSNVSQFSEYNFFLDTSNNNFIYNNIIDNTTIGAIAARDDGTNFWNITLTAGTNVIGGSYLGGNYWINFTETLIDTDGDGIGDSKNFTHISGGSNLDELPLATISIGCTEITNSFTLTANISANGSCMVVAADNITLDFAGYYLNGNNSGVGINVSNKTGIKIVNANIQNFSTGIYFNPKSSSNITDSNITDTTTAIIFINTNYSRIYNNRITSNDLGLSFIGSYNNSIYNNHFNNTINAQDDGTANYWNISYDCTPTNNSILGLNCSGGNSWSDYAGLDYGNNDYPHNTANDGIGDTSIPYTTGITGGDYLPLTTNNGTGSATNCISVSTTTLLTEDVTCSDGDGVTITANDVILDCNGHKITGSGGNAGISINGKSNVIIKNCNISQFYYGIKLLSTSGVQLIEYNDLQQNNFYAIYLHEANETLIDNNTLVNDNNGVYLIGSKYTNITNNQINLQRKFYGVYLFDSEDTIIENNTLEENYHGVYLVNSSRTNVDNNTITKSDDYSIFVHKSTTDSVFNSNDLNRGDEGIRVRQNSNNNNFTSNTITNHVSYGIRATSVEGNNFTSNIMNNNSANLYLESSPSSSFTKNVIDNSTNGIIILNSSNLLLHLNQINSTTFLSAQINESINLVASNNTFENHVEIYSSNMPTLNYNTILTNLIINASNNVLLNGNNITNVTNITYSNSINLSANTLVNLRVDNSSGSYIGSNTLKSLDLVDFHTYCTVYNNDVDDYGNVSFDLQNVDNCNIHSNNIKTVTTAILLRDGSDNNLIYDNWLENNSLGINITSSIDNTLYNNYFENTNNVVDASSNNNTWYSTYSCTTPNVVGGPCKGGNFYSDYSGLDNGINGGEEGDGIGDQPDYYVIVNGNNDTLPLVLYAARQYHHPDSAVDSFADSAIALGNISGTINDQEIVPNNLQIINYTAGGNVYVEITALLNQTDLHAETLKINYNSNQTAINKSGVTGMKSEYALYLYHNNAFDGGVYLCPDEYNVSVANATCTGRVNINDTTSINNYQLTSSGSYYKISNIGNTSITAVLNKGSSACGSNILHDITLEEDLTCAVSGYALNVLADNITIDFAGYSLTGNSTGIGINLNGSLNVSIINAKIYNFSHGIYINISHGVNLTNNLLENNTVGVNVYGTNYSLFVSNNISNNVWGMNLTSSYNNSIYDNYFDNINISAADNQANRWNTTNVTLTSGTNIIGGTMSGGNFWKNYTGSDTDADGIGETALPYNDASNIITGGDSLPLTEVGQVNCGAVTVNVTLGKDLIVSNICFNISNNGVIFDCAGYTITGIGGTGFKINAYNKTTIKNCTLQNFTTAIFINDSFNHTIYRNTITNNSVGINLTDSNSSLIYNNYFNNTFDVQDNGNNSWNITNTTATNILGEAYTGGNFWASYLGNDSSGDGIGDNQLPYNNSNNITFGGDYLPLVVSAICGDGIKSASEVCDGSLFGSTNTSCTAYGWLYGSVTCASCALDYSACTNTSTPSSSTSSSGGGGGGSSSSRIIRLTTEDNCTQSWECTSWSECIAGKKYRNCNDVNRCEAKKESGQVEEVTTRVKPDEVNSCQMPPTAPVQPQQPQILPPMPEIVEKVLPQEEPARTIAISSATLALLLGVVGAYWLYGYTPNRLRRKMKHLIPLLSQESSQLLKGHYYKIYNMYLGLSEHKKQNFYSRITKLREKIEDQLKSEKKMEELFDKTDKGTLSEQRKNYLSINSIYKKLPAKVQQKYYQQIIHLRDDLERGRKIN